MQDQTKYYKEWYKKNRVARNTKRRKRYAKDLVFRGQEKERIQAYRDLVGYTREYVPPTRTLIYNGTKHTVKVYRIGEVADRIERTPQTVRLWERYKFIPKSIFPGTQRVYTENQIQLMGKLAKAIDKWFGRLHDPGIRKQMVELKQHIKKNWKTV